MRKQKLMRDEQVAGKQGQHRFSENAGPKHYWDFNKYWLFINFKSALQISSINAKRKLVKE